MQPTGRLHLGNYLGALKNWVALQDEGDAECIYCVVDMHAITMPHDPKALPGAVRAAAAAYIAAGVNPDKSIIFAQSAVSAHAELAWIFNCVARLGWAERMTQFKDKGGKDKERSSVGLLTYPVLQAADILAYKATHVPVGEDQKQHLELCRDIAARFNRDYGDGQAFFPLTEPVIQGPGARIMSLRDGTAKMSKSDPSDNSRINLEDDADTIARKIKKAKTDPEPLPETVEGLEARAESVQSRRHLCRADRQDQGGCARRVRRPGLRCLQAGAGGCGRGISRTDLAGIPPAYRGSGRDRPHPEKRRRAGGRDRRADPQGNQGNHRLLALEHFQQTWNRFCGAEMRPLKSEIHSSLPIR